MQMGVHALAAPAPLSGPRGQSVRVIRRHERRVCASASAGGLEVPREKREASPEPPGVELDSEYYGAGELEGRLRMSIEDLSNDAEDTPSAEQSSSLLIADFQRTLFALRIPSELLSEMHRFHFCCLHTAVVHFAHFSSIFIL